MNENIDIREIKAIIEALLFVWGDPLALGDMSKILEIKENRVEEIINEMINDFNYNRRGIKITRINNKYQLCTREEHHPWISQLSQQKGSKNLSTAALETLSIIAYKQPVTKNEIENIRGVRSDKVLETLMNRNLIDEKGRLDRPGKPIIYGTTEEFLRYFGLENLKDLPELKELELKEEELSRIDNEINEILEDN